MGKYSIVITDEAEKDMVATRKLETLLVKKIKTHRI